MSRRQITALIFCVATTLLALSGCRDFDDEFSAYCDNGGCGDAGVDAGQLIITADTLPVRLVAGECGIANLRVRFENGAPPSERPQAEISFPAVSGRPQPTINKTNTCEEQISSVVIEEGKATVPIFMRDELAGSYDQPLIVYFPATDRTVEGTLPIEVLPAAPVRLSMTTAAANGRIGACTGPFEATLFDAFGNRATAPNDLPAELSSNSQTGVFHSNSACSDAILDGGIAESAPGTSFFFTDTEVGERQVRVSSTALDGGGALAVFTLSTAPPSEVVLTSAPQDVLAGSCSDAFVVEFSDGYGHFVGLESDAALRFDAGTVRFFSDPSCGEETRSLPLDAGSAQATFYVRGATPAAAEQLTVAVDQMTPATHTMTITSAGAPRLSLNAVSSVPFDAGSCNTLAVVAVNSDGGPDAPVGGLSVQLLAPSDNDAGFFFRTDTDCTGPVITSEGFDAGASTFFVNYKDNVAGTRVLRASAPLLVSDALSVDVAAGPVTSVRLVNPPATVEAGVCTPLKLEALDEFGNATSRTHGLALRGTASLRSERISGVPSCATDGGATFAPDASVTHLYWSAMQVGSATFTVQATDGGVPAIDAVVEVLPGPPAAIHAAPPGHQQLAKTCGLPQYYVELRDRFNTTTSARTPTNVTLFVAPVQSAATCAELYTAAGSDCSVLANILQIPDGGTRANFKAVTYSQTSCTYTVTPVVTGLGSFPINIRLCRALGAPCANNGDCCSGKCGLTLKCE